jgi:hypothetical protein
VLRRALSAFVLSAVAACGGSRIAAPAPVPAPTVPAAAAREAPDSAAAARARNRALFDHLVAEVRRLHVFSAQTEKNLGRRWEDELPALARELEAADTRVKLSVALEHFVNALHNPHCWFQPASNSDHLTLGFSVNAEWKGDTPIFRVWEVDDAALRGAITPGDVVVSVDGVPAASFVTAHALESRANNRRGLARDIGHWLTGRSTLRSPVTEGQSSEWVLKGSDGASKTVKPVWKEADEGSWSDFGLDYDKTGCGGLWPRKYGSYELAFTGARYCIYASKRARFRDYPIVRQFSFRYIDEEWSPSPTWLAHTDQRNLKAQLASLSPKGIVLDLRDNNGGNNPNWFLDWWAPAGWTDNGVRMRLDEQFRDRAARRAAEVSMGDGNGAWYAAQLDARTKGQELSAPRPFFCRPGPASDPDAKDCAWNNRYVPSHRVTTAPVALLVGAGCVSSCDSVAHAFDENDFGPLVGEPTAAAYTTSRMKIAVKDASGVEIGSIRIAISMEISGVTGKDIEAVPLHIDYPVDRTFDAKDAYDAALLEAAMRGFEEFRFPRAARASVQVR